MILTGKAFQDFLNFHNLTEGSFIMIEWTKPSVQHTLIIEWLDSVGIYIELIKDEWFGFNVHTGNYKAPIDSIGGYDSRQEATEAAIAKANEIYNEKYGK